VRPEPVVHFRSRVLEVRQVPNGETVSYLGTWRADGERLIATIGAGYADGFRRAFSNGGGALLRGRRVEVAGLVNMDMTMLDVTGGPCDVGDVATLLGRDGEAELDINDVSRDATLSPYELLVGLRMRVPRVYGS
jgi:alanine racemase